MAHVLAIAKATALGIGNLLGLLAAIPIFAAVGFFMLLLWPYDRVAKRPRRAV